MATTTAAASMELVNLDPRELVIGLNARVDVYLGAPFIESIRTHGVMQAVTAVRNAEGRVEVRMGQRRTLAAIEAGLQTIPVMIVPGTGDEAERIIAQIAENEQRADMTDHDHTRAAAQLALLGLTADQIAKRTGRATEDVQAALTISQHETTLTRMGQDGLTLEQAAALAEFEDDSEAIARIEETLTTSPGQLSHTVARIRQDRERAAAEQQLRDELTAEGLTVVDQPDYEDETTKRLDALRDAEGNAMYSDESQAKHAAECPGHVVWIARGWDGPVAIPGCTGWAEHGHSPAQIPKPPVDPAERKRTIERNRALRAAAEVRAEFVKTLLTGKTYPKGAEKYVALAVGTREIGTTATWLAAIGKPIPQNQYGGTDHEACENAIAKLTGPKAQMATLGMALGHMEKWAADPNAWKKPGPHLRRYIEALVGWGYTLSEVEAAQLQEQEPDGE